MAAISRMRTVGQTVKYFKDNDPETVVGEYLLRKMIKTGELPVVMAGNKALINLDNLIGYFNSKCIPNDSIDMQAESKYSGYGTLRKVEV
ncbi:helix-turn-helix domain-containing protein [Anaerosporobacter sp.]